MSDIVDRLRKENSCLPYYGPPALQIEAANEIEQNRVDLEEYRRDVERLRAALTAIRDMGPMTTDDNRWRIARAALEGKP